MKAILWMPNCHLGSMGHKQFKLCEPANGYQPSHYSSQYNHFTPIGSQTTPQQSCPLRWRHNERDVVSNHQLHGCLLNRLFRPRRKNTSKLRVTCLCERNSPVTGEFPAQIASNAENVSIWWCHALPHSQWANSPLSETFWGHCHLVSWKKSINRP